MSKKLVCCYVFTVLFVIAASIISRCFPTYTIIISNDGSYSLMSMRIIIIHIDVIMWYATNIVLIIALLETIADLWKDLKKSILLRISKEVKRALKTDTTEK